MDETRLPPEFRAVLARQRAEALTDELHRERGHAGASWRDCPEASCARAARLLALGPA